jgi:hypothetical protein
MNIFVTTAPKFRLHLYTNTKRTIMRISSSLFNALATLATAVPFKNAPENITEINTPPIDTQAGFLAFLVGGVERQLKSNEGKSNQRNDSPITHSSLRDWTHEDDTQIRAFVDEAFTRGEHVQWAVLSKAMHRLSSSLRGRYLDILKHRREKVATNPVPTESAGTFNSNDLATVEQHGYYMPDFEEEEESEGEEEESEGEGEEDGQEDNIENSDDYDENELMNLAIDWADETIDEDNYALLYNLVMSDTR